MNLNGGYVMLDLDDTSNLLNRVKAVYDSGKPLVVKYGDRLQFANFAKRASASSNYDITLSNNTLLDIHYFSGQLTENVFINTTKYRHTVVLSFSISSTTHKISFETYSSGASTAFISGLDALRALYNSKHISADSAYIVNDTVSGFASVYAEFLQVGGTFKLHVKLSGASSYTDLAGGNVALVSDEVTTI